MLNLPIGTVRLRKEPGYNGETVILDYSEEEDMYYVSGNDEIKYVSENRHEAEQFFRLL